MCTQVFTALHTNWYMYIHGITVHAQACHAAPPDRELPTVQNSALNFRSKVAMNS